MDLLNSDIYYIIMYSIPAAFYFFFNREIRFIPKQEHDPSLEVAKTLLFAGEVFIFNVLIGFRFLGTMSGYDFYLRYTLLTLSLCPVIALLNIIIKSPYLWVKNKINKKLGRAEEGALSVWEMAFESNELVNMNTNPCIAIYKSGQLVTAGIVYSYPSPTHPDRDFLLHTTDHIKNILEDDKKLAPELRVFNGSCAEYYDATHDILIKFYSTEKYDRLQWF